MFKAIKDTNTGVVYDWVNELSDGTTISVNIPSNNWKKEQEWTKEEIENLFSLTTNTAEAPTKPTPSVEVDKSEEEVAPIQIESDTASEVVLNT